MTFPTFEFPAYRCFTVQKLPESRFFLTYFVTGDLSMMLCVDEDFKTFGFGKVLKKYPGLWLNRNPYALYHTLDNRGPTAVFPFVCNDDLLIIPPDEVQCILPVDDVPRFERLAKISYHMLQCCNPNLPPLTDLFGSEPIPSVISRRILDYPLDNQLGKGKPDYVTLKILPPRDTCPQHFTQFLESLKDIRYPVTFSVTSELTTIRFELRVAKEDKERIVEQLEVHFQESVILDTEPAPQPQKPVHLLHVSPSSYFQFFKRWRTDFSLDPYAQLFALLSQTNDDVTSLNVVFYPAAQQFIDLLTAEFSDLTVATDYCPFWQAGLTEGTLGLSYSDKPLRQAIERRLKKAVQNLENKRPALWATVYLSGTNQALLEKIFSNFLTLYETPEQKWHRQDSPAYFSLYSCEELMSILHFPDKDVECDRLECATMKQKLPPPLFTSGGVHIGQSEARGVTVPVMYPDAVRDRHLYVIGKTGVGKSTLLFNIARQDIERGEGVAVIDPHGDLVQDLLHVVPESRIQDTIYLDVADTAHPIPLSLMHAQNDKEMHLFAEELLVTIKRLSESFWGPRMEPILRHTLHALIRVPGTTLMDVQTFLRDETYRAHILAQITYAPLLEYWAQLTAEEIREHAQPILNRMSKFALSAPLYHMLSSPHGTLKFSDVIERKQVLLVNLASGEVGPETSALLGSLIVSQFQLAVMRRARLPEGERHPYYLFVDEFQEFMSSAFEKILSQARKYQLSLTLAHQYISQLDDKIRDAIFGNVGTMIMLPVGDPDARALRSQLGVFEPEDLINLKDFEALCRPLVAKDTFKFTTLAPPAPGISHAQAIIEHTRATYSRPPSSPSPRQDPQTPVPSDEEDFFE